MSPIPPSHVSLIAVGVENYKFMKSLKGPKKDIENLLELVIHSPTTSLYKPSQIEILYNPDSNTLRKTINEYVIYRSAFGDVLIFYFSGHGAPIGLSDFAFCASDARMHDITNAVLPMSVLRFRDLIDSLRVMEITPVIIIDACYSGTVGSAMDVSSYDAAAIMQREITRHNATNYALLCSCTDRQVSIGDSNGGIFSQTIFNVLGEGFKTRSPEKSILYLQDVFSEISNRIRSIVADSTPQLFLGETIPAVPLVRNVGFTPRRYRFHRYMGTIISSLWNNGNERELSKDEILSTVGRGAYGNHKKLSYRGWNLLEDNPINHKRRLTDRGRQFAQGNLSIPEEVIFDPLSNDYIAPPDAKLVSLISVLND